MSRLGDLENTIVSKLSQAAISGEPAFATVRSVSGGNRPALREALRRERMPAAFVAFTDEPTAPEIRDQVRGAKFVVLVAARALRVASDPRHGDSDTVGTFGLLEASRSELDNYEPSAGFRLVNVHEKFVDADDRFAIYELLYRVWPVVNENPSLMFDGQALAGSDSRMALRVGPFEVEQTTFGFSGSSGIFRTALAVKPLQILWLGQVRAPSQSGLNTIESNIETRVVGQVPGEMIDGSMRSFSDCVLDRYVRHGSRRSEEGMIVQEAELHFTQLNPLT
ncbi:MAG: DUF1834 family protein [Phycisphaerales bacterium]|nr:DUF1834 family protein [Phycisphaerales bacterium]